MSESNCNRSVHCNERDAMKNCEFYGAVVEKFKDSENHNFNSLIVFDSGTKLKIKLYFINEKSGFYNSVSSGDTLVKIKDSISIKNISTQKTFNLKYDCKE